MRGVCFAEDSLCWPTLTGTMESLIGMQGIDNWSVLQKRY